MSDIVKIELSRAEAIVLFDTLNRLSDSDGLADAAEDQAAHALICALERHLPATDGTDYETLLARAKEDICEDPAD